MSQRSLPETIDSISVAWLTSALQNSGESSQLQVASLSAETIAVGQGFASGLGRLTIEYAPGSMPGPKTLIAKVPSPHVPTRKFLTTLGAYEREVRFYQNVASEIPMRTPKCFFAQWESETYDYIILLEDIANLRSLDQMAGCPIDDAELVVTKLAKLHASMWNNPKLDEWEWIPIWDTGASLFQLGYPRWWKQLQEKATDSFADDFRIVAEMIGPHVTSISTRLSRSPVTLCHGDFRLDNMFFDDSDAEKTLVAFDWQALRVGRPSNDLSYFMASSLTVEDRRKHQQHLKSLYFETLLRSGVTDYSRKIFDEDFDYSLLDIVVFTTMIGANLDFFGERGRQFVEVYITRVGDAISEVDTERLLAKLN
jgi:thiamine kinase-like enzyme